MSRSGYSEDGDNWSLIRWRGAVNSALRGKRGQAFLRELLAALDAMPNKRLVANELEADGQFCTLGVVGKARGLDMIHIDPEDRVTVANTFGIAEALAAEIMYWNDEWILEYRFVDFELCGPVRPGYPEYGKHKRQVCVPNENAANERWCVMRRWVANQIVGEAQNQTL